MKRKSWTALAVVAAIMGVVYILGTGTFTEADPEREVARGGTVDGSLERDEAVLEAARAHSRRAEMARVIGQVVKNLEATGREVRQEGSDDPFEATFVVTKKEGEGAADTAGGPAVVSLGTSLDMGAWGVVHQGRGSLNTVFLATEQPSEPGGKSVVRWYKSGELAIGYSIQVGGVVEHPTRVQVKASGEGPVRLSLRQRGDRIGYVVREMFPGERTVVNVPEGHTLGAEEMDVGKRRQGASVELRREIAMSPMDPYAGQRGGTPDGRPTAAG